MRISKIILCLFLAGATLGFARAYALNTDSLKEIAGDVENAKENYDQATAARKQIEAAKTPEQAFAVLESNASTLGINAQDLGNFKTAFFSAQTLVKSGSSLAKTLKQLSDDPDKVINDPQALAKAKQDIDSGIQAFKALEDAADKMGSRDKVGNSSSNLSDLKTALNQNPPNAGTVKASAASASSATTTATSAAAVAPTGTSGGTTAGTGQPEYMPMRIKNWESQGALILSSNYNSTNIQTDICDKMFAGDEKNLFKDVICSLVRVVSASTAQFATDMTCNIQGIPASSNYLPDTSFSYNHGQGVCRATSNLTPQDHVYGVQADGSSTASVDTGLYDIANTNSSMTNMLLNRNTSTGGANATNTTFNITKWVLAFVATAVLILFAFANILGIEVNTYAIKKALPRVVFALVGGWLSLSIIALVSKFVDVFYQLNLFSPYQSLHPMANIFMGNFSGTASSTAATTNGLADGISLIFDLGGKFLGNTGPSLSGMLLGSFFLVVPAITVLIFEYVLALRPFIVGILAAAGPLAFASLILPQTQFLFKKWASYLGIALFYPLVVNFIFFFLNKIDGSYGNGTFFAVWAFKIVVIFFLVRLPFAAESDLGKISRKISSSGLIGSLGLSKLLGKGGQTKENKSSLTGATDENLSSNKAKSLIAPVAKNILRNIGVTPNAPRPNQSFSANLSSIQGMPFVPSALARLISNANQINSGRNSSVISNSIQDISGNAFRAIVDRNDLQLWRDTRLIEQLKNKDGQLLDDQGAAIRVDSVRKAMRLAQIAENGKLVNGSLIKLLASKGMLSSLPNDVVREAVAQNVIEKEDLMPSYGANYQKVLDSNGNSLINSTQALELMAQDHQDYLTGFNEIKNGVSSAIKSGAASSSQVVGGIAEKIRQGGLGNLSKNSDYYLQRLSADKNQAIAGLASTLNKAGVESKTAMSLAQNSSIGLGQIAKYMPKQNHSEATFQQIKEGLLNRDVSSGLIGEISGIITQEKVTSTRGITQKIAETFKNDETANVGSIRKTIEEAAAKLSGPLSPAQVEEAASAINRYHPGAKIKTNQQYDQNDIDQIKARAQEVLETTDKLQSSGYDEKKISQDPIGASRIAEVEITKDIQAKAQGTNPGSDKFEKKLSSFAKVVEGKA